jgi:hypothetical protein
MVLYVTHLIQQKLKPYLKRVQSVSLVEQIGMVSVEEQVLDRQEQENEIFFYRIVLSRYSRQKAF